MTFRFISGSLGALAAACLAAPAAAQSPPDVLDDLWVTVCAQAAAGSAFRARCDEILDAGPGGAGRRSNAAIGNNLGVASAQARASSTAARIAAEGVDRRLEDVKEDQPGGGGAFEWTAGRLSIFFSGDFSRSDREQSDFETGYEADSYGGTVGADYRFGDRLVTGLALSFANSESDYDANVGDLDTDSLTATAYASYSATENLYFDAYAGHGWLDYEGGRTVAFALNTGVVVNGAAAGDT